MLILRKKKHIRGGSILECAIALAFLMSVSFFVARQDIFTLYQMANDAKKAQAMLYLVNEGAKVRNSILNDGGFIPTHYPTTLGTTNSSLINLNAHSADTNASRLFTATARRSLISANATSTTNVIVAKYKIELDISLAKGDGTTKNETVSATAIRSYYQ